MGKFIYKEELPENAEILIDYTKPPRERVAFDYPVKRTFWQSVIHAGFGTFLIGWFDLLIRYGVWIALWCAGLYVSVLFASHPGMSATLLPTLLSSTANQSVSTTTYYCSKCYYVTTFTNRTEWITAYYNYTPQSQLVTAEQPYGLAVIFVFFLFFVGVPFLAAIIAALNGSLSRMVPQMNYGFTKKLRSLRTKTVMPTDIERRMFILPYFHNVYLDWEPTGDFDKYLQRVEILAIPMYSDQYDYLDEKMNVARLRRLARRKNRSSRDEYSFRCVFYFSRAPKTGNMKIIFH